MSGITVTLPVEDYNELVRKSTENKEQIRKWLSEIVTGVQTRPEYAQHNLKWLLAVINGAASSTAVLPEVKRV